MLAYTKSGQEVVMAHMSLPTPQRYVSCIVLASFFWTSGSGSPMAALNFLSQVGSDGSGVGLSLVVVKLCIHDERYFSQILSINVVVDILM